MRRGFTLLELMAAVLIGIVIIATTAGVLNSSVKSWTKVQEQVGRNYNRRMVLDLVKRQTSSMFFKRDAESLMRVPGAGQNLRQAANGLNRNQGPVGRRPAQNNGFGLPAGAHFFRGNVQELNFLSTVSFLSDFPGQVAVRYYVVQGEVEEGDSIGDAVSSRSQAEDTFVDETGQEELLPEPEIEGDLWLVLEEKNLFLNSTTPEDESSLDSDGDVGMGQGNGARPSLGDEEGATGDGGEIVGTHTMKLIGPLRKFTIRYRVPAQRNLQEEDTREDWAEVWDLEAENMYPTAVEFILFYEIPGVTEDLATEDLPGVRMVIPIYDTRNLARVGGTRAPL